MSVVTKLFLAPGGRGTVGEQVSPVCLQVLHSFKAKLRLVSVIKSCPILSL